MSPRAYLGPHNAPNGGRKHAGLPTLQERNDRYIRRVFRLCGGSVGKTAGVLGVGRATLYRWLLRMGFKLADEQASKLVELRKQKRVEYLSRPARTM